MQNAFIQKMDRLRDLYTKWGLKTAKLKQLNAKASELQPRGDLTPSLLRRLSRWVEQIAGMEDKERDVISEITAIEEKHLAMRKTAGATLLSTPLADSALVFKWVAAPLNTSSRS